MTDHTGDVIGITEADGKGVVEYAYDDWGNMSIACLVGEDGEYIANANPLRYRGYYYDAETGYYYLQSRYYDPSICRFINADTYKYIDLSNKFGTNLFTYCDNNPINKFDLFGFWGADIHYGRKHKKGKDYDGTYEWAILAEYRSKYAEKIAKGDLDVDTNKNTTPNPLRAKDSDKSLAERQKYHFNRAEKGKKDSRAVQGDKFYKSAVSTYKAALKYFKTEKKKLDKKYINKNDKTYKSKLYDIKKKRNSMISTACFTLGKALHCFQDIYAHGNITAGPATGKNKWRLKGHVGQKGVDNVYYNWEPDSNWTKVVKTKKLSQRYYDTQDKTLTVLLNFLYDVNYSSIIKR